MFLSIQTYLTGNIITEKPDINITGKMLYTEFTGNSIPLTVTSKFSTAKAAGQTSNEKNVQSKIVINVPNYQDSYSVKKEKETLVVNPVWKNAISIDGNMKVNSQTEVVGDIFVKGDTSQNLDEKVFTKYNGGITIGADNESGITATFKGDVSTPNSFNINGNNNTANISGNIYAGNVYVGKGESTANASECNLTATGGAVYTSNDLSLYALKSHINIEKYYGINDITKPRTSDKDYNSSSSIIVNTDDIGATGGSTINIGDAVICGTAYINATQLDENNKLQAYQTGESVAVKGNYKAYTTPLTETDSTSPYYNI